MNILNSLINVYAEINRSKLAINVFVIVCIVIVFSFLSILYFNYKSRARSIMENFKYFKSNVCYVINLSKKMVDSFDFINLRKINTITLDDFYSLFSVNDQTNIKNYLTSLVNIGFNKFNNDAILDVNVSIVVDGVRLNYKGVFNCVGVDKENQIITIELIRLMHTPIDNRFLFLAKKKDFENLSIVKKKYDEKRFHREGFTVVRFYIKNNSTLKINSFLLRKTLIDAAYSKINPNDSFVFLSGDEFEFSFIQRGFANETLYSKFLEELSKTLDVYLELRGLSKTYGYNICGGIVNKLPLKYDNAYNALNDMFRIAKEFEKKVSIYNSKKNEASMMESSFKIEIKRIIQEQDFKITFSPIVHVTNSRVAINGYYSFVEFNSSLILVNEDVYKYARDFNLNEDLISVVYRKMIPTFISQTESTKKTRLYIDTSILSLNDSLKIISHVTKTNGVDIVLTIRSSEFIDLEETPEIELMLLTARNKGHLVDLKVRRDDYVLKEQTYNLFDEFVIEPEFNGRIKAFDKSVLSFDSLLTKIRAIGKPMIALGLPTMESIDFLNKSGVKNFSSDIISPKSPMVLPLKKKIINKLLANNKY